MILSMMPCKKSNSLQCSKSFELLYPCAMSCNKSKVFPQSYTIFDKEFVLSITPTKVQEIDHQASFGFRKDYITVTKQGVLVIELCPLDRTAQVDRSNLGSQDNLAEEEEVRTQRRTSFLGARSA